MTSCVSIIGSCDASERKKLNENGKLSEGM